MSPEKKVSVAERLKEAMKDTGKRQVDLIRETGLDCGAMSHYITGKYEPKQTAIHKLAIALDVSEMWLCGFDVPKERTVAQQRRDVLLGVNMDTRKNDKHLALWQKITSNEKRLSVVERLAIYDDAKLDAIISMMNALDTHNK